MMDSVEHGCYVRRIHAVIRGKVSALNYEYSGSWDIPINWLEQTGLMPYQKIALMNPLPSEVARERMLYTYILPTERGTDTMNANGGIAYYFQAGGDVVIQGFGAYAVSSAVFERDTFTPVFLEARSSPVQVYGQMLSPDWMDFVAGKLHLATVNLVIDTHHVNDMRIYGDVDIASMLLAKLAASHVYLLGQIICVVSQDLAEYAGFSSFEAISLYPANGNPRFNRSVMCYVISDVTGFFAIIGDGATDSVFIGDRMIACRYITLPRSKWHQHTADVHILNEKNESVSAIYYAVSDYVDSSFRWHV
jgi:aspartate 1-decarboxylase